MRIILLGILCAFSSGLTAHTAEVFQNLKNFVPEACSPDIEKAYVAGEYQELEALLQKKITGVTGDEKSALQLVLAVVFLKDQKEEEAFRVFVDAIRFHVSKRVSPLITEDTKLFNELLPLYLESSVKSAVEVAGQLEDKTSPIVKKHPEYFQVEFLLASALANKHKYDQFFYHFYKAYSQKSDCYLAYKTSAILHIKLFEKARTEGEKEEEKKEIQKYLNLAIKEYNQDPSLYKLKVAFHPKGCEKETLCEVFQQIDANNVVVPKTDISFYVQAGVVEREIELTKGFLDKTAKNYEYSRSIEEMQNLLQQLSAGKVNG